MRQTSFLAVAVLMLQAGTAMGQQESCLDCHPDKKEGKVVHAAISMGCASCHSGTHAGEKPAPKLVSAGPDLCFSCHDSAMVSGAAPHPPAKDGQCTFCHSPHGSDQPALLTQPAAALCASCHDKQATGRHIMSRFGASDSHPVSDKPDPSRTGKTLSCASCHKPHGANLKRLFPAVSDNGLPCMVCHKKISAAP